MYCSHCGKKVTDTMLFCPFCGDPIVIPEQDEPGQTPRAESNAPVEASKAPADKPVARDTDPEPDAPREAERAVNAEPERPSGEKRAPDESGQAPVGSESEAEPLDDDTDDAAAELLDWSRTRREYEDDIWSRHEDSEEAFEPLNLDESPEETEDWKGEISRRKQASSPQKRRPDIGGGPSEPVRLDGVAPRLDAGAEKEKDSGDKRSGRQRKHANTLVPPKPMDPKDIFMDGDGDEYDAMDEFGGYGAPKFEDGGYVYEDEDESSFFMRHLRGFVGLAMFVILILLFVIYALSPAGQLTLAKANLAWSPSAYNQLGYQNYQDGHYAQAGQFFERALQRDSDNYSYASSAAMAYKEAENTEKAAEMLMRCTQIDPSKLEPYIYLLDLYPDAAQRPWEVSQALQQGYQMTGDKRLNVTG